MLDEVERALAAVDAALTADTTRCSDEEVKWAAVLAQRLRNKLAALDHRMVAEVERRGLPTRHGARSTAAYWRHLLRLDPYEATARVAAAHAAGSRRALTGETLEPAFAVVAAAQAAGEVTERQAKVVVDCVQALPAPARAEAGSVVERDLVTHAATFDALLLGRLARRISDCLDPDGTLRDADYRRRERHLHLTQRPDGSARVSGELTAECAERLATCLDAFGAPNPAGPDGVKDARTGGQRRHDALLAALELCQRSDQVPNTTGVSATVVVIVGENEYRTGQGLASTGHGALVPAGEAIGWGGGDTRVLAVAINDMRAVTDYGHSHRIFTETQRLAIWARDRGCTFPGCSAPPQRCQVHHVIDWADGGPTSVDNGALVCNGDHRDHRRLGWTCTMINKRPAWLPPPWIDPDRKPIHNHMHDITA